MRPINSRKFMYQCWLRRALVDGGAVLPVGFGKAFGLATFLRRMHDIMPGDWT